MTQEEAVNKLAETIELLRMHGYGLRVNPQIVVYPTAQEVPSEPKEEVVEAEVIEEVKKPKKAKKKK